MKLHEIKALQEKKCVEAVQILRSPSNTKEWILLFTDLEGKSNLLATHDDQVCSFSTLDAAVETLDSPGFSRAGILF